MRGAVYLLLPKLTFYSRYTCEFNSRSVPQTQITQDNIAVPYCAWCSVPTLFCGVIILSTMFHSAKLLIFQDLYLK